MAGVEARISREEIRWRHFVLGKAALIRFSDEVGDPRDLSVYDMVEDADKIQLENPKGKERWEVIVSRYGKEMELRQYLYSDAGQTWQTGRTFRFDIDVVRGFLESDEVLGEADEAFLTDEKYFGGLADALAHWPLAKWYVLPLEARFGK